MTTFATQSIRRAVAGVALAVLTVFVGGAGAADITVSKATGEDAGMFKTIQEAVNAAKPGQVIEILDVSVYEEQVTIDGRGEWDKPSEWDNKNQGPVKRVMGGKNGITIKYSPPGGRLFGNHARPTIKWKDTENTSPKNFSEGKNEGQQQGQSGNFETNGALRILWAQGVTIDGIKVDGGGLAPFLNPAVWPESKNDNSGKWPLFHGNAAITLAVAGGTIIRNCDITNGYFGINVKDRNTGGVFGNPNPGDNDKTIPLSGFGKVGNHLFEYNKIHGNMTGMFFESSWDLGSTIRYNLIYSNTHRATLPGISELPSDAVGGAILFKDVMYTPVAIYNNTFYNNSGNILAGWKVGAPHLIFNNIFGKPNYAVGGQPPNNVGNAMFEHRFPFRMHNTLFAATADLKSENRHIGDCKRDAVRDPQTGAELTPGIYGQQIGGITQVRISNNIPNPSPGPTQVNCLAPIADMTVTTSEFIAPGGLITGTVFERDANIRWLETTRSVSGTEDLFVSTDTSSADFLRPKWDHTLVTQFIKNKGWTDIGMKNSDGSIADIGAIPSTGRAPATVVRIKPSNVVLVTGTNAKASFFVNVESGELRDAKITFLRWVAPLPTKEGDGNGASPVPKANIHKLTAPSAAVTVNGNNTMTFTIPQLPTLPNDSTQYGFFEVVVSGKDASGNDVVSDIGFLPYRKLEYTLKIEVFNTAGTKVTTVNAGEQYRLRVTPCKGSDPATCGPYSESSLNEVSYELQSDAAAFMYTWNTETPLVQDGPNPSANMGSGGKDYNVYFTRAGAETIMGAGVAPLSNNNRLVFLGTADITVKPGAPEKVIFIDPIPLSQLGSSALAPVINRGVDKTVIIEVQDKYGNAVDVPTRVDIVSDNPNIGDVGAPGAIGTKNVTTGTDGVAKFTAKATNGKTGDTFIMTATITVNGAKKEDQGKLRLGRALDRLEVFYSDTTAAGYDPDAKISGGVGDWFKVTVKVLVGDDVNTAQTSPKVVSVSADNDGLVFSAASGGASATEFPLNNGVATFWISGTKDVTGACIDVEALVGAGGAVDGGISPGNRCEITFIKPSSSILRAVVYGDGHGRPDSLLIYYAEGDAKFTGPSAVPKPDKVTLTWPTAAAGVVMTANAAAIDIRGDYLLHVNLTGAAISGGTARPRGYTGVERKLVTVYGGSEGPGAVDDGFDVVDGIGPVIGVGNDEAAVGNPILTENVNAGVDDDVITIKVSEQLRDAKLLEGKTLFYTKDANPANEPGASGGDELEVVEAFLVGPNTYQVTVKPVAGGLKAGDWIRFNPNGGVADRAKVDGVIEDNKPHPGNRWAQLRLQEVAPNVRTAWYTSNIATGFPDYAYVVFDKSVSLGEWFSDGSLNFGKNDVVNVAAAGLASLLSASGDTLIINLATAFKSSQTSIRTSEDMPFTLGYASGKKDEWEGATSANVLATDRAKPVLADTVFLYIGDVKDDGSTTDTLRVTYSEKPSEAALALEKPVSIFTKDGQCEPVLKLLGQVVPVGGSSRYYKATYLIEGDLAAQCPAFPETGNMVRIDAKTEFGDDRTPSNQLGAADADNKRQPLKVVRELKWSVKVKGNPFKSDAVGSSKVKVEISPNAPPGVNRVNIDATIMVFDNLGALVRVDTLKNAGENKIEWPWDGTNQKGRLVGTGTYLFKALCRVQIVNDGGGAETMPSPPAVVRSLGVIRGRN